MKQFGTWLGKLKKLTLEKMTFCMSKRRFYVNFRFFPYFCTTIVYKYTAKSGFSQKWIFDERIFSSNQNFKTKWSTRTYDIPIKRQMNGLHDSEFIRKLHCGKLLFKKLVSSTLTSRVAVIGFGAPLKKRFKSYNSKGQSSLI